ncbi:MAG TPA: hypothetical protein VHN74_14795 [Candidatus Angelobacter sp.]|jgi:uncharacterized membrane protein|nr:hypothetical protein [Candidatus Angelobacter sp.]
MNDRLRRETFWTRHSASVALTVAIVAFVLGVLQDEFLAREGWSRWTLIVVTNLFAGVIAGGFFYGFARAETRKRELLRERMRTVAELNHHVRNALQVIKFWGVQHEQCLHDDPQIQLMKDSVERIEWALREVLPQYPEPTALDSSHGDVSGTGAVPAITPEKVLKPH